MTTYAEERVLRPMDPVPDNDNDWPDFAIREVKIFHQGKGRYADILEASEDTPLCVLGELVPVDDEQEDLVLISTSNYARIKIDNVTNYSFGQNEDGQPVVWAAGKAGWYELTPSAKYISHYDDTIEAIDMFYFMCDQHQNLPRKRQRFGFQIDPFLTAYQKRTGYRIDDDDEAMETIHKHHRFLLKQMIEEREGIDWSQTHLWKHLAEAYASEVESFRQHLAHMREHNHITMDEDEDADTDDSDVEIVDAPAQLDGTSESTSATESVSPDSAESSQSEAEPEEDPKDWTSTIWELLNVLRKLASFNIRECGVEQLADELQKIPAFDGSHKQAVSAIERSAEPLLRLMNEAKLRKKFNWSTRAIYDELEATLADDVAHDVMKTPSARKGTQRHRMKSVLRPSGAGHKASKRAKLGPNDDDDDAMMVGEPPTSSPIARRQPSTSNLARHIRETTAESAASREDSPSRQLNGHFEGLPDLPAGPEAQEMLDLVAKEAKLTGRLKQMSHLEAFLGQQAM